MSFDWQQASKERYFRRAEELIKAAGFEDFLQIDRSQFGIVTGKTVKVHIQPIKRNGNMRRWWEAKRVIPEFRECPAPRNQYGKPEKTIFLRGYFEIEMEEQDK